MDDDAIVEALKKGKPEGARELVQRYGDRLLRSACRGVRRLIRAQKRALGRK